MARLLSKLARRIEHYRTPRALVLMYHRVAEPRLDSWELAVSPAHFEQQLRVLRQYGPVIGAGELAASRLEIKQLYVAEDWIGTGLGAALMRRILDLAQAEHCTALVLGVWERNERAKAFYQRFGFREIGAHTFTLGQDVQRDLILRKGLAGRA